VIEAATGDPFADGSAATESEIDDAVDIANDSEFGLGGAVWSADVERATEIARSVRTGTIGVNDYQMDIGAPFGGVKASGIGRDGGDYAFEIYMEQKNIAIGLDKHRAPKIGV
jgi:5-carboxymethyl-2-hydroxymuconic-semialdehyde dehydrogenase